MSGQNLPDGFDLDTALYATRLAVSQHERIELSGRVSTRLRPLKSLLRQLESFGDKSDSSSSANGTEFLTVPQVALILDCSSRYVRRIAKQLGGQKVGKVWLFDETTVRKVGKCAAVDIAAISHAPGA